MHTPDEHDGERSLLSATGSELGSPKIEKGFDFDSGTTSAVRDSSKTSPPCGAIMLGTGFGQADSPRMQRMSTSGTQVFTPTDDGMEIDGLPVGPSADIWSEEDKGKGRRIRSFLCLM